MTPLHRYVSAVSAIGIAVLVAVVVQSDPSALLPHDATTWLLAIALIAGECLPMRIVHHGSEGEITTSSTFALALLLTAGAPAAMVVMTVAAIVADLRQRKSVSRMLFNVGQYAIVVLASAVALSLLSDLRAPERHFAPEDLAGALAAAATFFVVNAVLVSRAVALVEGAPFWRYLRTDLAMQTSTVGILLGLGPILVIAAEFSLLAVPLLALPLIALHGAGRRAVNHQHDALHDVLTGLPNRTLLQDRIEQALALGRREGHHVAVMLVDLDRFKEINDTLGHQQGDEVLCGVAGRLREQLRESDTVARLGGDEFAIVLRHVADPEQACRVAAELATAVDSPFVTNEGLVLDVRASIGIAIAPTHGDDAGTLLRKADIAMYQAKQGAGTGAVELYTIESDESTPERLQLVADLRMGIERRELVMHFQPKVSLRSGRVEALEALVRWQHPQRGLLYPKDFLDTAERSGLMGPLTSLALEAALLECRAWQEAGLDIGVAVNLPPEALRNEAIVGEVDAALERFGIPGRLLQLELTEDSLVADAATARAVLHRLRELGVGIAIDDFGTGYSSLGHLTDLPVDEIKIDRRFVAGLDQGTTESAIVRSTIGLAHDLGLRVVAEGVETSGVLAELSSLGCDAVQGYLLGRPTPASSVWPLLSDDQTTMSPAA